MKKRLLGALGFLAVILAGCSTSLTTNKTTYHPTALTAVIKGDAKTKQVTYQVADHAKHQVAVNAGTYFFQVPAAPTDQKVTVTAGHQHKTVTVKATKSLANYQTFAKQYNQMVIGSYLPSKVQKQLQTAQKTQAQTKQKLAALAKRDPAAAATAAKQQQAAAQKLQGQLATAKRQAKDQLFPTTAKNGIHNLISTKDTVVRANVQDKHLMGLALIVPTKQMKTKTGQRHFGTTFALLGSTLKANPQYVIKKFEKVLKDAKSNSSSTKTKTIRSNNIRFNTGFSTDHLYIYMTK
ncbi:hypothetical protein [Levilactobacillus namurensis]|uniref:hypothetical protein n=1 Tax=Levilactobacillus namurensis TaxID=380393 RepID=UPI00222F4709|nr:hypothetical protein [Levilactobacillus namurensis]MCW3778271.1 hypothetical protein [Levilactobacillus namurensis]MDT7019239.1 hypothetical protein [Levilactobacillus namurensis]WNN66158.1 hypothetical protein RIN67_03420 [Levilactobacillus namurensis]